jgi:hypothetical protein
VGSKSIIMDVISWLFGIAVFAAGILNTCWGNDPGFGAFLILLSFVYFPPANAALKKKIGFRIPLVAKILLGLFIIWASLGVGELFAKIDLLMHDF